MELWDIMNEKGETTGRTVVRGRTVLRPGEYHLVVHIWVIDSAGRFLIQRRSDQRRLMPGEWAATGGSAVSGEDSLTAAARELREELGIKAEREEFRFMTRFKRRNAFLDVWFLRRDADAGRLRLQRSEVAEAKWITPDSFAKMIEDKKFHNYGKEYFKSVFAFAKQLQAENAGETVG